MLKSKIQRAHEADGYEGVVFSKIGKIVDCTAVYNTRKEAEDALTSLVEHWSSGGDAD